MRAFGLVAAALLLTGCVSGVTTGGEQAPEPTPTTSTAAPSIPAEPDPEPEEETAPESPDGAQPCEDVMFQRAQGTIRAQQSALAESDFEAARAYASDNFRAGVSVDQFQQIIEGRYGFLLEDPALTFTNCRRNGDSALIRVEVAGSPIRIMVYGVVLENESWFIDAASAAGTRESLTT